MELDSAKGAGGGHLLSELSLKALIFWAQRCDVKMGFLPKKNINSRGWVWIRMNIMFPLYFCPLFLSPTSPPAINTVTCTLYTHTALLRRIFSFSGLFFFHPSLSTSWIFAVFLHPSLCLSSVWWTCIKLHHRSSPWAMHGNQLTLFNNCSRSRDSSTCRRNCWGWVWVLRVVVGVDGQSWQPQRLR
jgi:hypothetical protein